MNRLIEIGFKKVGHWYLEHSKLQLKLTNHASSKNVLYAFISNGDIRYIGKTTQQLKTRFSGYKNPSSTQSTNINNNANIQTLLKRNEPVDIFVLPDNGLLNYGGFTINLSAGLEDALIRDISPLWNGGKKEVIENSNSFLESNDLITDDSSDLLERFEVKIGEAYYNQGFFNVSVKYQELFGSDGEEIEIFLGNKTSFVTGYINRTANSNKTPRIMGGKELKAWIKKNFNFGDTMHIGVYSEQSVIIEQPTKK